MSGSPASRGCQGVHPVTRGSAVRVGALALVLHLAAGASAPSADGDVELDAPAGPVTAGPAGSADGAASEGWGDPAVGPSDAAVTLLEFTDYACPYSRKKAADVLAFAAEHPGLRVVFKMLPLLGDTSTAAAVAAVAAARQPGWATFHAALMSSPSGTGVQTAVREAAMAAGMDLERLVWDSESKEAAAVVEQSHAMAEAVGVDGTPTYVIAGRVMGSSIPRGVLRALLSGVRVGGVEARLGLADALRGHSRGFGLPFLSEAIDLYSEVIGLYPENVDAYTGRSIALMLNRDFDGAIADAEEAMRLAPNNASGYETRARVRKRMGDLQGAVEDYGEAIRVAPNGASAFVARARLRKELGDLQGAVEDYGEAIRVAPDQSEELLLGLDDLRDTGAVDVYADVIRQNPDNVAAYFLRGSLSVSEGGSGVGIEPLDGIIVDRGVSMDPRKDVAAQAAAMDLVRTHLMADLGEVIRLVSNDVVAHFWRGVFLERQGDLDGAGNDFTEVIRRQPRNAWAYYHRSVVRRKQGDFVGALQDLDEGIRLRQAGDLKYVSYSPAWYRNDSWGGWEWMYFSRGLVRQLQDDHDGAIEDFTEAIRIAPRVYGPFRGRGVSWQAKGDARRATMDLARDHYLRGIAWLGNDPHRAVEDFGRSIDLDPRIEAEYPDDAWARVKAYLDRAKSRKASDDRDGALADYNEAIRLEPDDAWAYLDRGWLRVDMADHRGAAADFDEAVRLNPDFAQAYSRRGLLRMDMADYRGAVADFDEAIRLDGGDVDAYYNRGVSRSAMGDRAGALTDYNEAIRLDPEHAWAYFNRGMLREHEGDHTGAVADYGEATRLDPGDGSAHNALAWILAVGPTSVREGERAVRVSRKALTLEDSADVRDTLAAALVEVGEFEAAVDEYEAVIQQDPEFLDDYRDILVGQGYALKATTNYDAAMRAALGAHVREGCQLVPTEDRRRYQQHMRCGEGGR